MKITITKVQIAYKILFIIYSNNGISHEGLLNHKRSIIICNDYCYFQTLDYISKSSLVYLNKGKYHVKNKKSISYKEVLFDMIRVFKPNWLSTIHEPLSMFTINRLPEEILECIKLLKLCDLNNNETYLFWKKISNLNCQNIRDIRHLIGDAGEELILDYEVQRLKNCGMIDFIDKITRVSKISDKYGYDIHSFSGNILENLSDDLFIEVKTSHTTNFYLTRNEWETMIRNKNNYRIYFLYNFRLSTSLESMSLLLLSHEDVCKKINVKDNEDGSKWEVYRLFIDINEHQGYES